MGLSPYSNPADGGVLCIILVNTAISISIIKEIVCSVFRGIRMSSWTEYSFSLGSSDNRGIPSETYMEDFRNWNPSARYDSLCDCDQPEQECTVCLTEFEPNSAVSKLACGHIFHTSCLETWLKYWSVTCPLCRNTMMPQEEEHLSLVEQYDFLMSLSP